MLLLLLPAALTLASCGGEGGGLGPGEVQIGLVAPIAGAGGASPTASRLNAELLKILPKKAGKNWVFDGYINQRAGDVAWSSFWTKRVDFTGVAWDTPRTMTLITPRHVVMAKHYPRKPGELVRLHDSSGREVQRVLMGLVKLDGAHDVAVGILSEPVPPGIRHYKLLAPADDLAEKLSGTLALVTDSERKVHVHECGTMPPNQVRFRYPRSLPKGFYEDLIKGDSGNPSFVLVRGEPVLLETHTSGGAGAGPFYGSAEVQAGISAAIAQLAVQFGGGDYSLGTVRP